MAMDVSTLVVKVESKGIDNTTKSLDNLTKSAETAEKYVQNLMDRMGKSSQAVNAVVSSMYQLRAAMNGAIPTNTISAATAEFKKMSDELRKITDAMGKGVGKGVTVNIHDIGTSSKEAVKGVESLNQSLAKGQNVFQAFGKELYHIRNLLGGTMLAAAMGNMAGEAIRMADAWTLMGAKLKMQLGSTVAAGMAQEQLFQTAQKLRVPMNDMITLYSRLIPAMSEYGYTTKDAMSITTAMGAALKVSGATGAEAASVMLQFSQAMQSGRLNGAEFNAVAEGAPIILRLIGKEINKTRGELKAMGAEGSLSVEVITEALKKNEAELVKMSKTVPDTVESAFVNLKNSMTKYIGEVNNATGVTGLLASMVKGLASNLETVGAVFKYTLIAGIVGYTSALIAHNVAAAQAVALNTALARSLGITAGAATTAAGATGLFATALNFIARHPVIIALTAITTGLAYLYDNYKQTSEAGKEFTNQLAEIDKLSGSQAASAYNMLMEDRLDKMTQENNKLTELLEKRKQAYKMTDIIPLNAAIDRQRKAVADLAEQYRIAAIHKNDFVSGETVTRVNAEVAALQKENKWLEEQVWIGKKLTDVDQKIWETKAEIKKASEGAHKENLKQVLTELEHKKALSEWLDNTGKKTKKAQSDIESFDKKYMKMVESLKLFIANQEEELGLRRKLTAAEKEAVKIEEFIANNRSKMTNAEVEAMTATKQRILLLGEQQIAQEKINKDLDEYYERIIQIGDEESKKSNDYFKVKEDSLQKTRVLLAEVNGMELSSLSNAMSASDAEKRKIQNLNDQISKVWELKEAKAEAAYIDAELSGDTAAADRAAKALKAIQDRIKGIKDQIKLTEMENAELDKQLDLMFKISQIKMAEIGRTPGAILADGFGEAGKAIGGMVDAYDDFGKQAKQINAELQAQLEYLAKKGASPEVIAKAEEAAADKRLQINAQMYGSMAGMAKGYFKQQSTAYKVLEKTEKAFRAIELALAVKSMVVKLAATETTTAAEVASTGPYIASQMAKGLASAKAAVAAAYAAPFPLNLAIGAAVTAAMAAIGFSIAGAGKGGTSNTASSTQAAAGTGSVLGDSSAKSESVTKALETLRDNSEISLRYNEGMLSSLRNIESAIAGMSRVIIKTGIQGKVGTAEGMGTFKSSTFNKAFDFGEMGAIGSMIFAPIKAIGNALFSVKKSVVDSGLIATAKTLSEIDISGLDVKGYQTIETKKKKMGKTKTSEETNLFDIEQEIKDQMSNTVLNMADAVRSAASVLGVNGDDFTSKLDGFVVDIGRISLQGLSAEQIQEQFTNIFSKMGDDMARMALPQLEKFQNVGEGYLETLVRVSSTVATVDGIFKEIGQTFNVVGIEGVDAKMKLVELAGGLQELSGLVKDFYENFYTEAERNAITIQNLKEQFAALNIPMIDLSKESARIDFRNLVNSFKDTNSEVYLALLKLAPAFASVTTEIDKAVGAVENLNESLKGLADKAKSAAQSAYTSLEKSISAQKSSLKKTLDDKIANLNAQKKAEDEAYESQKAIIQAQSQAAETAYQSQLDTVNAQIDLAKEQRDAIQNLFDDISNAIQTLTDGQATLQSTSYNFAKSQLDAALLTAKATGVLPNAESFKNVTSAVSKVDAASFASAFAYNQEKLVTAGKLADLQGIAGTQLAQKDSVIGSLQMAISSIEAMKISASTAAETQLTALEAQHKTNIEKIDEEISIFQKQYEDDVFYLDGILQNAKDSLEMADGTYQAVVDVETAVNDFNTSLQAYLDAKDAELASRKAENEAMTQEISQLRSDLAAANRAIAANTLATAKILDRWDGNGQPETRVVA